jgi:hypothetical protein
MAAEVIGDEMADAFCDPVRSAGAIPAEHGPG